MHGLIGAATKLSLGNGATIGDFWSWAMSDLLDNVNRGVFAEFLVGQALGCALDRARQSWDDFDLRTPEGTRIEVKSTGRYQSWGSESTRSVFTGLRGRALTPDGAKYDGEPKVRADVFVFCYHSGRDALAMTQWQFHVVSGSVIDALNQKSITLFRIRKLAPGIKYEALRQAVCEAANGAPAEIDG